MDPEDLLGNSVDVCLLKSSCSSQSKRKGETNGKYKVKYRYCIFPNNCNQKRRTTKKQIILDYLKSKNDNKVSRLIKKLKKAIPDLVNNQ